MIARSNNCRRPDKSHEVHHSAKANELLEILEQVPDDPRADRELIERWAKCLGLGGSFHFQSHSFT